MATIDTELGIEIDCDTTGTFSAKVNGDFIRDKSLAKVRKAIKAAKPTIPVIVVGEVSLLQRGARVVRIAHIETWNDEITGVEANADRYGRRHRPIFEFDQSVLDSVGALREQCDAETKAIRVWYNTAFSLATAALVPMTEERFAQLMEEAGGGDSQ